ncbi:hypothetical protein GCM10010521_22990 [Streptomyces rameus]|uniref:Deoxyribonuclease NucA/NucB domain-containing protein n=1 Tax=Streptomyces rameus TaxID=68261 RepID=A0ABP6N734_9ACTN
MTQSARHILDARRRITGHPGESTPLHRITDERAIKAHRKRMCAHVHNPDPSKYDCDECPVAASKEGGNPARGSTRIVSASDNRIAGARLGGFYKIPAPPQRRRLLRPHQVAPKTPVTLTVHRRIRQAPQD